MACPIKVVAQNIHHLHRATHKENPPDQQVHHVLQPASTQLHSSTHKKTTCRQGTPYHHLSGKATHSTQENLTPSRLIISGPAQRHVLPTPTYPLPSLHRTTEHAIPVTYLPSLLFQARERSSVPSWRLCKPVERCSGS